MNNQNLLVPINLEAIIVKENDQSIKYASLTPHFSLLENGLVLGDDLVNESFSTSANLEAGLHLHWALPDALTHGIQTAVVSQNAFVGVNGLNTTQSKEIWTQLQMNGFLDANNKITSSFMPNQENFTLNLTSDYAENESALINVLQSLVQKGEIEYPNVPNRWFVTRMHTDSSNKMNLKSWIIESDRLYEYDSTKNDSGLDRISIPIRETDTSALDYKYMGNQFEYENWSVDKNAEYMDDFTALGAGDPVFAAYYPNCKGVFGFYDKLDDIEEGNVTYLVCGWYSDSSKDPLSDNNTRCMEAMKWSVPEGTDSLPKTLICHGMICGMERKGNDENYDSGIPIAEPDIAVGNTSVEALAALLKENLPDDKNVERLLEAFQYNLTSNLDEPDGLVKLEHSIHERSFSSGKGGIRWIIKKVSQDTDEPIPEKSLMDLNKLQEQFESLSRKLCSVQWEIYSAWYKYVSIKDSPSGDGKAKIEKVINGLAKNINDLKNNVAKSNKSITDLKTNMQKNLNGYELVQEAAARFWEPNEPVVLMSGEGIGRSFKHGSDGILACRVTGQTMTATQQDFGLNFKKLQDDIQNLVVEAILLDPTNKTKETLTGILPAKIAVAMWQAPWTPLFMQWEVNFLKYYDDLKDVLKNWELEDIDFTCTATSPPKNMDSAHQFKASMLITPNASINLQNAVKAHLETLDPKDKDYQTLQDICDELGKLEIASQSLSGFNNNMIMRRQTMQFPVFDIPQEYGGNPKLAEKVAGLVDGMDIVSPIMESNFNPIRAGFMQIMDLRIVDAFGRIKEVNQNTLKPVLSENLITEGDGFKDLITLRPRISQSSRINFNWLNTCGWIMPNHLDNSLMVYDADGKLLGFLQAALAGVRWLAAPGVNVAPEIENEELKGFVDGLLSYEDKGGEILAAFLENVDETLWTIDPLGARKNQSLSMMVGRPLALVSASIKLELEGLPVYDQDISVLGKNDTQGFDSVGLPVRLGDIRQVGDGLIGYFVKGTDMYKTFHAVHGAEAKEGAGEYIDYEHGLELACGEEAVVLSMLVDPRAGVHVSSGLLPVKYVELDEEYVAGALAAMEIAFQVLPVLNNENAVSMPVPDLAGKSWGWVWKVSGGEWQESLKVGKAGQEAGFGAGKQVVREGWLRLRGNVK